jgi:glycosyltransferase involved in cell wall biosynthesis
MMNVEKNALSASDAPKLRVLLVCGSAPPMNCGVGDYTAGLARELAALGTLDIGLLTTRVPGRAADKIAGVEVLEAFEHWTWGSFAAARATLRGWPPDLLHIQYPAQGYDGLLLTPLTQWFRRWRGRPVVATMHEHVMPHRLGNLLMAQAANVIVSVRPNFRAGYRKGLSWTTLLKPFHFIPNASTLPQVEPAPELVRAVRQRYGVPAGKALVAYFGLLYPRRGVDQLFQIADPAAHHLVIVGGQTPQAAAYHQRLTELATQKPWHGSAILAGFLPDREAAAVLASADAVVLPFVGGGGIWNTSLHAARLQGTFVVATSTDEHGYDPRRNVYWARSGDIDDMRQALGRHLGTRQPGSADDVPRWPQIAEKHRQLYQSLCRL